LSRADYEETGIRDGESQPAKGRRLMHGVTPFVRCKAALDWIVVIDRRHLCQHLSRQVWRASSSPAYRSALQSLVH